jgi:thiamine biosynthesis lipoprotein
MSGTGAAGRDLQVVATEHGWAGRFRAMGSPCEVLLEGGNRSQASSTIAAIAAEAWRVEDKFSRYRKGNIVDRINTANGNAVTVDDETADLLDFATTLYALSDGRFDITSGVLREVWTFDGSDRVPAAGSVKAVLARVGWSRARWERPVLTLASRMQIDLGGIGKEYAVDRCIAIVRDSECAPGLVNFGGDLAVSGPPARRRAWKVAVEGVLPDATDHLIDLRQGALATSGDAQRFLFRDGIRYSHILDPRSGWPVPHAPASVTVAADTCTQAGMTSTLAMLEGERAEAFLEQDGILFWCRR